MAHLTQAILSWFSANHPILLIYFFWPLVTALLSIAMRRKLPEKWQAWAMKYPKLAFVIELLKAWGLNLPKVFELMQRYAMRKAGESPEAAWKMSTLPEPLKKALQDPVLLKRLEDHASAWMNEDPTATPKLEVPTPVPPADPPGSSSEPS